MTAGNIDYVGRLMNECYLIEKGVRSAYTEVLTMVERDESDKEYNSKYLDEIKDVVNRNGLLYLIEEWERDPNDYYKDRKYYNMWVVKYPHQLVLVKKLPYIKSRYLREYLKGKILGYSDESMEEYLSRNP